jgi:hypothetical protein
MTLVSVNLECGPHTFDGIGVSTSPWVNPLVGVVHSMVFATKVGEVFGLVTFPTVSIDDTAGSNMSPDNFQ